MRTFVLGIGVLGGIAAVLIGYVQALNWLHSQWGYWASAPWIWAFWVVPPLLLGDPDTWDFGWWERLEAKIASKS